MSEKEAPKQRVIELNKLNIDQLNQLQQQFEEEQRFLVDSYKQLQNAISRYEDTRDALTSICPENSGKELLIPVTGSMFVPGKIGDIDSVVIDVGTGYFVKRSVKEASNFSDRRIKLLESQTEIIKKNLAEKKEYINRVIHTKQEKIMEANKGK